MITDKEMDEAINEASRIMASEIRDKAEYIRVYLRYASPCATLTQDELLEEASKSYDKMVKEGS